ncbi:MAG: hypothetical protein K2H74_08730 [Paramuribaculum sp.]|nr:hypothetical protein [Paramuribaculum sp.]
MTTLATHPVLYWFSIIALVGITVLAASAINNIIGRHCVAVQSHVSQKLRSIERK